MTKEEYTELCKNYVGDQPQSAIDSTWEVMKDKSDEDIKLRLELAELDWKFSI